MQKSVNLKKKKKKMKINIWKIQNIVKPEMIVIMQGNIDKLRIPYTIKNIVFLKKSL